MIKFNIEKYDVKNIIAKYAHYYLIPDNNNRELLLFIEKEGDSVPAVH